MGVHTLIQLVVVGARGRMGERVCACAESAKDINVVAAVGRENSDVSIDSDVDLIIDFSTEIGVQSAIDCCREHRAALLVATTGLSAQTIAGIRTCAQFSPVMIAPNTSRGVAVLNALVQQAAQLLSKTCDIDIIETHHAGKRDRPSGTALRLAHTIRGAEAGFSDDRIHSVRSGEIFGEHFVQFSGSEEVLRLSHAAQSRDLFAAGALDAGRWLCQQPPGVYDIAQAWGLPRPESTQ